MRHPHGDRSGRRTNRLSPFHSWTVATKAIPRLVLLSLAFVSSPRAGAQTPVEPPRTIRVVMDNAYPPYVFQSDDGKLQGRLIDQWQAWEQQTGIKVEIHAMDWGEAVRRMRAGEFDVIDCIVETPERRNDFDFTPAYATVEASIFFRDDISGITDLASLKGFPVGVKAGDQHIDRLKENGVTTVIPFRSNDEIIEAAKRHRINVFVVDAPSALYLLNKLGIEGAFRHSVPFARDQLRRAVRKGDLALLRTVAEGFAAIEPDALRQIDERWSGRTMYRAYRRYLTYGAYAAAAALLLIAGLVAWNRLLSRRILQRTAALGESEQRFRHIAEQLDASVSQLHALAGRLMHAQDDERRRIAQLLHETTAQDLAALKMHLARLNRTANQLSASDRAALTDSIALAEQAITEIRTLSYLLHPPFLDEAGLLSALRWYAAGFAQRSGIKVDLDLPDRFQRPPLDTETALFRIVQEALINIHRHAGSETARIRLQGNAETLVLEIEDRGHGIPQAALQHIMRGGGGVGVGIAGMSERIEQLGGTLEITSDEHGTTVRTRLPLVRDAA
jgi:signal transduction histidine kinase